MRRADNAFDKQILVRREEQPREEKNKLRDEKNKLLDERLLLLQRQTGEAAIQQARYAQLASTVVPANWLSCVF